LIRYGVLLLASVLGLGAGTVSLDVSQYVNANRVRVLVFAGTTSSRAGGEYVEVLGRDCGARSDRLIAGTRTSSGGGWRVENPNSETYAPYTPVYSGTSFRARWDGDYSAPIEWRLPATPRVARISGTRTWVVHVMPATPTGQVGFQGKTVELQRLTPGGWVRVRTARLARKASLKWGPFNFQARFTVPTRGLRLRAYLPEQSAAPCYLPGASKTWRS
jgi:hypothetical protein